MFAIEKVQRKVAGSRERPRHTKKIRFNPPHPPNPRSIRVMFAIEKVQRIVAGSRERPRHFSGPVTTIKADFVVGTIVPRSFFHKKHGYPLENQLQALSLRPNFKFTFFK